MPAATGRGARLAELGRAGHELAAALGAAPGAREFVDGLDSSDGPAVVHRINTVRKAETRVPSVAQHAALLGDHGTIHP